MNKKILLVLLTVGVLFIIVGCKKSNTNESLFGHYYAYEIKYGINDEIKKENIKLILNEDNTASLSFGNKASKTYKIEGNRLISVDETEICYYTYEDGVLKLESTNEPGYSIYFKKK